MACASPQHAAVSACTVVLGLGNPVRCDDGVGIAVAEAVQQLLIDNPLAGVRVATSARGGFEVIDLLQGCQRAVIIDCLDVPHPRPGRVRRLALDQVAGAPRLIDAHGLSLPLVFRLAAGLGIAMPSQVEILGVEAADTLTLGETLTPAVLAAVAPLARRILVRLALWGLAVRGGRARIEPSIGDFATRLQRPFTGQT